MNIPMFTFNVKRFTFTLIIIFILNHQNLQAQELFTLQNIEKTLLSPVLQNKLSNLERSAVHKRAYYVSVGNFAKIQQKGILTFTLPNGASLTFNARKVEAESDQNFTWVGVSDDGLNQAFFISKEGKLFGSFESKVGNYQLYAVSKGVSVLLEVDLSKMGECTVTGSAKGETTDVHNGGRQEACQEATRVLVLYTQAAANLVPDVNQVADLSIQQYNSALSNSNIGNRITNTLVKAGVEMINFTEGTDNNSTNDAIRLSQLTAANNLRNQYNADIVITLTGDVYTGTFGSVANDIPANNSTAYAVVIANQASLAGAYTFSHETGHLYGGRHDLNFDSNGPSYAHGYQLPGQSTRTLMSVRNNGDLSRLLYYSNPDVSFNGTPTGTVASNNVARRVGEISPTIVGFRPSVSSSFFGYVDGPSYVSTAGTYPFEIAYQCIQPSSYVWSVSTDGFNFGSPIGYGEQIYPYLSSSNNGLYYIRCQITLPNGQTSTPTRYVNVNICSGCRTGKEISEDKSSLTLVASPNPTSGSAINIQFNLPEEAAVSVTLTDTRAVPVRKIDFGKLSEGRYQKQVNIDGLNAGIYLVSIQAGSQMRSQKVLLSK